MRIPSHLQRLIALIALAGPALVRADIPPPPGPYAGADPGDTVVIVGTTQRCSEAAADRARSVAEQASRNGDYQRAGECYLAAGDKALADRAFIKAVARNHADTARAYAAAAVEVKAQASQLKAAFRR